MPQPDFRERRLNDLRGETLKSADIIKAATINAARMIGREKDSGTIEEGKVADLLIFDANPLDDIRNINQIHRIIKGELYLIRQNC